MALKTKTLPIVSFESAAQWKKWLAKNHDESDGVWLQLAKKDSGRKSPTYSEALDVALCYGWIDGQGKTHDEHSWLQKYTRRRPKSGWSKKNTEHVKRLIEAGLMKAAGLAAVDAAKKGGRWKTAYDSPSKSKIPADFLKRLSRNKKALKFFESLNKTNLYAISYRLQTAKKPETREKRIVAILKMLKKRRDIPPLGSIQLSS